MMMFEV